MKSLETNGHKGYTYFHFYTAKRSLIMKTNSTPPPPEFQSVR